MTWFVAAGFILFILVELTGFINGYPLGGTLFKSVLAYGITLGIGAVSTSLVRSFGSEKGGHEAPGVSSVVSDKNRGGNIDIEIKDINTELARNPQRVAKEIKRLMK